MMGSLLGRHAPLAIRLVALLWEQTGCNLPPRALFKHPTLQLLADQLSGLDQFGEGRVILSYGQKRFISTIELFEVVCSINGEFSKS